MFDSLDYYLSGYYYWLRSGWRAWARELAWELYTWLRRLDGRRPLGRGARRLMLTCYYLHCGDSLEDAAAEAGVTDVES